MDLYVSAAFSGWQATVLEYLQSKYVADSRSFAPNTLGAAVVDAVKAAGTAGDTSDKVLKGQCIPFARAKHDEALASGPEVPSAPKPSNLLQQKHKESSDTLHD